QGRICQCVAAFGTLTFDISIVIFVFRCSLVGIALMFAGLYVVLWAKNREDKMFAELALPSDSDATESDIERPFLQ
uniref:WAT1-related protein n=1 Tax=Aegilops tauschii subsp. strangulata TaxID=200361 RepID=A0A453RXD6_AEGTS